MSDAVIDLAPAGEHTISLDGKAMDVVQNLAKVRGCTISMMLAELVEKGMKTLEKGRRDPWRPDFGSAYGWNEDGGDFNRILVDAHGKVHVSEASIASIAECVARKLASAGPGSLSAGEPETSSSGLSASIAALYDPKWADVDA